MLIPSRPVVSPTEKTDLLDYMGPLGMTGTSLRPFLPPHSPHSPSNLFTTGMTAYFVSPSPSSPPLPPTNARNRASSRWEKSSLVRHLLCQVRLGLRGVWSVRCVYLSSFPLSFSPPLLLLFPSPMLTMTETTQIGKILGARVIGIAGSSSKCTWLTQELGIDGAYDYKDPDWRSKFRKEVGYLYVPTSLPSHIHFSVSEFIVEG